MNTRNPQYKIDPIFINRWSPRSFAERDIPDEILFSLFEAARWSPSGGNQQPWRYIIARTKEQKETFLSFINEGNRKWCKHAPVLTLTISNTQNNKGGFHGSHAFDAGTSWGYLALEAINKGLITHAMGGFDKGKAVETLGIPKDHEPHAVIAIGYQGEKEQLPEDLQKRENPNDRKPLQEILFDGHFNKAYN